MVESSDFIIPNTDEKGGEGVSEPILSITGGTSCCTKTTVGNRTYLVKTLRHDQKGNTASYRNIFYKEFEVGKTLDCPYIVRYEKLEEKDGQLSIWMDYVEGKTLDEAPLDNLDVMRFAKQLLQGMQCMHQHQIVHLDLKPDNIMLTHIDNNVKIIDLGFCYSDSFTHSIGCSKSFASPEQLSARHSHDIDQRSDIYSFGKILLFIEKKRGRKLPGKLRKIALRCTKVDREKRYQSVDDILKQLNYKPAKWIGAVLAVLLGIQIIMSLYFHGSAYIDQLCRWFDITPYDFKEAGIYYNILSKDSMTVEVTTNDADDGGAYPDDTTIPETVTHHGKTYTVTRIGNNCFYNCDGLLAICLPNTLESIGDSAFARCGAITTVNMPDGIRRIGKGLFRNSTKINSVRLPEGIADVPEYAFSGCKALRTISIPQGVKHLGRDAFGGCNKLTDIKLPEKLEVIDRGVFWDCQSLRRITIPASVKSIGDYAFWYCNHLKDVYVANPKPIRITQCFKNIKATLHVPQGAADEYSTAESWSDLNVTDN